LKEAGLVNERRNGTQRLYSFRDILLTHHWLSFDELLRSSPDAGSLLRWSLLSLAYAAVFFSAAWARITTADVSG